MTLRWDLARWNAGVRRSLVESIVAARLTDRDDIAVAAQRKQMKPVSYEPSTHAHPIRTWIGAGS